MYPILLVIGDFHLHASVIFLTLGIVFGILVGWKEAQRVGISMRYFHVYWISAIPLALLFGALNALVFGVGFLDALRNLEYALSSGLVSFGAILWMLLWGYLLAKVIRPDQPDGLVLDTITLIIPLILGIYRIGCILNGCCYGLETDSIFGMYLPRGSGNWANRFPTQIMLMIFNLGLFAWLLSRRKQKTYNGSLTIAYLFFYSLGRLLIDSLRDLPRVLGLFSLHQLTSIAILLISGYVAIELWQARRAEAAKPTKV